MKNFFFLSILLLALTGCVSQPSVKDPHAKPDWILNPNKDGKRGAIGVAGRTYDQRVSTQRQLAITRALDELTLQQGVKVNLNISKSETVTNQKVSTQMDSLSDYKASSTTTAHIKDIWEDKRTGELYIWMVMD